MKKIVFSLILLGQVLFGCSLCSIYTPNAHIKTQIIAHENNTFFNISWEFDSNFVKTLSVYDQNNNGIFDPNEKDEIEKALLDYIKEYNFLTNITYDTKEKIDTMESYTIKDSNHNFELDAKKMVLNYSFSLDFILQENNILKILFYDQGNNFNFIPKDTIVKGYDKTKIIQMDSGKINIYLYNHFLSKKNKEETLEKGDNKTKEIEVQKEKKTFLDKMSDQLEFYKGKIESLLKDIKENNSIISYLWLLVFSFLYGVLHALGPGHGKSLVGAYFLSEKRSTSKAFYMATLIGVVHTFSAFIMTLVVYYLLSVLFSNFFTDVEYIATKISAIIIIMIALYMIYKKLKTNHKHQHSHSCSCGGCQSRGTDLGVIISSGIVPCPGTVTIFLFTIGLGVVFVGFLSAIFMSLGMSVIIFITAYLSSKVRQTSTNNTKLIKFFEYGSLIFILLLGLILFLI